MRLLAGSLALTFALLLVGFALGAAEGPFDWRAAVTAGVAILIVAGALLYAWPPGAPGPRQ